MWRRIKKELRYILSRNKSLYLWVEGIYIRILLSRTKNTIESKENRFLRARVLRHGINTLKNAMESVHYKQGILVVNGASYAFSYGIFLNLLGSNRYLKVAGDTPGNEGKKISDFLESKGIKIKKMIDLGANFGEISIYLSKKYPLAKILAVEASPDNFEILKSNCAFQNFSTKNIILLNEAASDKKGLVKVTKGVSGETGVGGKNIVIHSGDKNTTINESETEEVASDTLESFMRRFDFDELDFLKVDIEGSEPLLYDSLKQRLNNIKSILIEIGGVIDHENYFSLLELLWNSGMECYERQSENRFVSLDQVKQEILSYSSLDLWFIRK